MAKILIVPRIYKIGDIFKDWEKNVGFKTEIFLIWGGQFTQFTQFFTETEFKKVASGRIVLQQFVDSGGTPSTTDQVHTHHTRTPHTPSITTHTIV